MNVLIVVTGNPALAPAPPWTVFGAKCRFRGTGWRRAPLGQTVRGEYQRALTSIKAQLDRARLLQISDEDLSVTFVFLGRLNVERGHLSDAEQAFREAEARAPRPAEEGWQGLLARERASLYLSKFEYKKAQESASNAQRLSARALDVYAIRVAYARALLATAYLRLGEIRRAEEAFGKALDAIPKNPAKQLMFAPRILYSAALIESHKGDHTVAQQLCDRALDALERSRITSRDVGLGLLTLAEVRLLAGDLKGSREAANRSLELTKRIFGVNHQDAVSCLQILALVAARERDTVEARNLAADAMRTATALFGAASVGAREVRRTLEAIGGDLP